MSGEDGTLDVNPISGKGYRGELKRKLDPEHRRRGQPMYHRMPAGTVPEGEQDFVMDIKNDFMEYREGDILDLAGRNAGLGMQFHDSNPDTPLFYSSMCYWLEGEVLGDRAEGPIFFDSVYWPHGRDWKEYVYFRELQIGWHVFANKNADGTVEWGHLVNGHRERFAVPHSGPGGYGITEACLMTLNVIADPSPGDSSGKRCDAFDVEIRDDSGVECPPDVPGVVYVWPREHAW